MTWARAWREVVQWFGYGPARKQRRKPCSCGRGLAHSWQDHDKFGCRMCRDTPTPCLLNRDGKPTQRKLVWVKSA